MPLTINHTTRLSELNDFIQKLGDNDKIRGKKDADGNIVLYKSTKGSGTGFKKFFGLLDSRRQNARVAIAMVMSRGTDVAYQVGERAINGMQVASLARETRAGQFKPLVRAAQNENLMVAHESFMERLPEGLRVDQQNRLTGSVEISKIPMFKEGVTNNQTPNAGKSIASVIRDSIANTYSNESAHTTIDNIKVVRQASSDFYRLNYSMEHEQNTLESPSPNIKDQATRNSTVTKHLATFAGNNANATLALSKLLVQGNLYPFVFSLQDREGNGLSELKLATSSNCGNKTMRTLDAEGNESEISGANIRGLGNAKYTLSKDEDSFKIRIDFPAYYMLSDPKDLMTPVAADSLIQVKFETAFIVDRQKAESGELEFTMEPLKCSFNGQLSPMSGTAPVSTDAGN